MNRCRAFTVLLILLCINASSLFAQKERTFTFYGDNTRLTLYSDSTFSMDDDFIYNPFCGLFHSMTTNAWGTYSVLGDEIHFNMLDYSPKFKTITYDSFYADISDTLTLIPNTFHGTKHLPLSNTLECKLPSKAFLTGNALYPYHDKKRRGLFDKPIFQSHRQAYSYLYEKQLTNEDLRQQLFLYLSLTAL